MIVNPGEGLVQQKLEFVVSEVGNQDPKMLSFFYLMYAGCCREIVFRGQSSVWLDYDEPLSLGFDFHPCLGSRFNNNYLSDCTVLVIVSCYE